jgi:hypothetical protein
MTEDRVGAQRRRVRRPTEAAARLERLRKRNADQLRAQRDAERRIESALQAYVDAEVSVGGVEQTRDGKIANLEQQIEQVRAAAQEEIEQIRLQQAVAVWQISDAGRTVQQISELLEIPQKDTRQLLSTGRTAAAYQAAPEPTHDRPADGPNPHEPQQPPTPHAQQAAPELPSEQRILSGVDAHQHGPNPGFVPAVLHGSGQGT